MSGALANSISEIVTQLIIDLGLGTEGSTWPVYTDFSPDTPDNLIAVFSEAGKIRGRNHVNGEYVEHNGIQIAVRSSTFSSGEQKARAIAVAFDEDIQNKQVTISSNTYVIPAISRTSNVLNPSRNIEGSRRNLFTFHCLVPVRQIT
jgi:hypothetical protein